MQSQKHVESVTIGAQNYRRELICFDLLNSTHLKLAVVGVVVVHGWCLPP